MITLSAPHNHPIDNYHRDKFALRAKCKMTAKSCSTSLRDVFNDTTRHEESALQISFKNCELMMYRARLELQPKIPMCALDFSTIIKECPTFNQFLRKTVIIGDQCSVIFFSESMKENLSNATNLYFDGTFKKCPKQFYQLWTVFVDFGRHILHGIHCLLTSKSEEIYTATLANIKEIVPQMSPSCAMGDWEQASRNAIKTAYPSITLYGCLFHHNQAVWRKITKLGLVTLFHASSTFKRYIKSIMNLPLLPVEHIEATFTSSILH